MFQLWLEQVRSHVKVKEERQVQKDINEPDVSEESRHRTLIVIETAQIGDDYNKLRLKIIIIKSI